MAKKQETASAEATESNKQKDQKTAAQKKTARKKGSDPDSRQISQAILESRNWDRRLSRLSLRMALAQIPVTLVALIVGYSVFTFRPDPAYFAIDTEGRIIELVPLDEPIISSSALLNWTVTTVTETLSLDFLNWRDQLNSVRNDYNRQAYEQVVDALRNQTDILDRVEEHRLNINVSVREAPIITEQGVIKGTMTWRIEVPLVLSFESSEGVEHTEKLLATVLVNRVSSIEHRKGMRIRQLVVSRANKSSSGGE